MTQWFSDILSAFTAAPPGELFLLVSLMTLGAMLHLWWLRIQGKRGAGILDCAKWLTALALVSELSSGILDGQYQTAMLLAGGLCAWMAMRTFLHGIYGDIYLARIKHRPVNTIHLNLLSFAAMLGLAFYWMNTTLQVNVGALLTSSAILTAVVGLSMQDSIGSLFSGLLIQMEKPFQTGDWIKVGEHVGQVTEITWRYTKLVTANRDNLLIPNNIIGRERLLNMSQPISQVRLEVDVPAPVTVPPVRVKSALEGVLRRSSLVAAKPEALVRIVSIGRDEITYRMLFYVEDYLEAQPAKGEVLSAVWYAFQRHGIDIPMTRRQMNHAQKTSDAPDADMAGLVRSVGLFAGMRDDDLNLLTQCSAMRSYPPGAIIVVRGQTGVTMFLMVSGRVSVRLEGKELSTLGPGDMFGEMALLTGEPRQADVVSLDAVRCLEVDREAFRAVLEKNPAILANITQTFQARERDMQSRAKTTGETSSAQSLFERFRNIFW